jgi:CheY-like chemotaxis protein
LVTKAADLRLTGIHVLVVDDNEDALYVLRSYLEYHGACVLTARSGADALATLIQVRAHVIVSDLSMPGMTGIDFIRLVRALPGEAESPTPAIAVTAFDDLANRRQAQLTGFEAYLTKPVNPMTVVEEVERLHQKSQAS